MNMQAPHQRFANRKAAGDALADALTYHRGADVLVLGLPRGGVPVAARIAEALAGSVCHGISFTLNLNPLV